MNYTDQVAKGAAELDRILPGWYERVDLDRLDLGSECDCPLGQLAKDMQVPNDPSRSLYDLALDAVMPHDEIYWDVKHGFNLLVNFIPQGFADLTEAWKSLIRQRLEA